MTCILLSSSLLRPFKDSYTYKVNVLKQWTEILCEITEDILIIIFFPKYPKAIDCIVNYEDRNTSDTTKIPSVLVCGLIAYLYLKGHIFIRFAESFYPSGWLCLQSFFLVFKDGVANPYVNAERMCAWHQCICIPSSTLDSFRALRVKSHQANRKVHFLLSKFTMACVLSSPPFLLLF